MLPPPPPPPPPRSGHVNMKMLRTFLTLVEERSTSKAGARLGMSKSNVLVHITSLEKIIGAQLLERRFPPNRDEAGRTQLTEAGRAFLPKALAALQAHDRMFDDTPLGSDPREANRAIASALVELALSALRHDLSEDDRDLAYGLLHR